VFLHLINYLDGNKYDAQLVLFEDKIDYQDELKFPVKIVCLGKKNRWDFFKLILKLRKVTARFQPDVVMSFLPYANIIAVIAGTFSMRKFRLILCEHSYPRKYLPLSRLRHLRKWLMKRTYRKADRIVTVSKSIKSVLQEDFSIQPEKIVPIYNPVLLETIRNKSEECIEHPFFRDQNAQIIIGAGRLIELKRFDLLLRAFSAAKRGCENARLIILGKGELQKELEDLALQLNVSKWVDFVGYKSNPYAWISKADIFVLSSDYEGLPCVILEAMACGVPVVSTDCPSGPGEIITNGQNGFLVPVSDDRALADALLTLLKNKDLRKKISAEGKKRVEDFGIEKILPQYEELFM